MQFLDCLIEIPSKGPHSLKRFLAEVLGSTLTILSEGWRFCNGGWIFGSIHESWLKRSNHFHSKLNGFLYFRGFN